jgi:hypothetical protein
MSGRPSIPPRRQTARAANRARPLQGSLLPRKGPKTPLLCPAEQGKKPILGNKIMASQILTKKTPDYQEANRGIAPTVPEAGILSRDRGAGMADGAGESVNPHRHAPIAVTPHRRGSPRFRPRSRRRPRLHTALGQQRSATDPQKAIRPLGCFLSTGPLLPFPPPPMVAYGAGPASRRWREVYL